MLKSHLKVMQLSVITIVIFLGIGITGLISSLSVLQSADAWHARFESREECMYYYKMENLNTTGEAARICDKIIPHTNVTITVNNRTTMVPLNK